MLIFVSDELDEQLRAFPHKETVIRLIDYLKSETAVAEVRKRFVVDFPFLHRQVGSARIVAREVVHRNRSVMCLLALWGREDEAFHDLIVSRASSLEGLVPNDDVLERVVAAGEAGVETTPMPPLPLELSPWLQAPPVLEPDECIIYEAPSWTNGYSAPGVADEWRDIARVLQSIAEGTEACEHLVRGSGDDSGLRIAQGSEAAVVFLDGRYRGDGSRRTVVLLAAFASNRQRSAAQAAAEWLCGAQGIGSVQEEIDRAEKAYPSLVLAEPPAWKNLQNTTARGLALSPQEVQLLADTCSPPNEQNSGMPVFINGRAGSGKSTMLAYLFAAYLKQKWELGIPGQPVFLTYSAMLRDTVSEQVLEILDFRWLLDRGEQLPNSLRREARGYFRQFDGFLYESLGPDSSQAFELSKRVDYGVFRTLFERGPGRAAVGVTPELAWHVVRTYIKGRASDAYTSPDEYFSLGRSERSVTPELYQVVYEKVWRRWYQPLSEDGYWDQQDLVRQLLSDPRDEQRFLAVFCDEAQDFTRNELNLLLRLSVYPYYSLDAYPGASLPFAFAGDPFQTLNPTGFRWETLTADYHNSFTGLLGPSRGSISMNRQDLTYNYRSSRQVVQVGNSVLLLRAVLTDDHLVPQEPWSASIGAQPVRFVLGQNIQPDELRRFARDTILVVPCEPGEEEAYVRSSSVLAPMFDGLPEGAILKNVFSAASIKGCEHARVVVFGFGDACPESIWRVITGDGASADEAQLLTVQYFLNKVYVAATRAQKYLYIVDTPEGDSRFWSRLGDAQLMNDIAARMKHRELWLNNTSQLPLSPRDTASQLSEDNPRVNADAIRDLGNAERDATKLRSASQWYHDLGDLSEAARCEAYAAEYDGDHRASGNTFKAHGFIEDAARVWWRGSCWQELDGLVRGRIGNIPPLHAAAATLKISQPADVEELARFVDAIRDHNEDLDRRMGFSPQWAEIAAELPMRVELARESRTIPSFWPDAARAFATLAERGLPDAWIAAARCYHAAGLHVEAIAAWQSAGAERAAVDLELFRDASRHAASPQIRLECLRSVDDWRGLRDAWAESGKPVGGPWDEHIPPALESMGDWNALVEYRAKTGDSTDILEILKSALESPPDERRTNGSLTMVFGLLLASERWQMLVDALALASDSKIARLHTDVALASALARSTFVPDQRPSEPTLLDELQGRVRAVLQDESWTSRISLVELGAALERAGHLLDALTFYEKILEAGGDQRAASWARQRWLAVKNRQLARWEADGNHTEKHMADHRGFLERRMRSWRVAPEALATRIPPYPMLQQTTQSPGWLRSSLGSLDIQYSFRQMVVVVADRDDRMSSVRIDCRNQKIDGTADYQMADTDNGTHLNFPGRSHSIRVEWESAPFAVVIESGEKQLPIRF